MCFRKAFFHIRSFFYVVCLLTPFLLIPLAISPHKESKCAYIVLWMAVYWMLEPVNLSVTALLPVVLMPAFGILSSGEVCSNYMKEVLMMFFGGLAVAVAVEHCRLHERIALRVLLCLGSDTKWLMLGFMTTSMFLSMWISNTATTAMMAPIVNAMMSELRKGMGRRDEEGIQDQAKDKKLRSLHKTLLLSVSYSANCGGTGTITGTSPNMILKGLLEELHPGSKEVTYASWMMYNVPGMVMCVFAAWCVLQAMYVPCWKNRDLEDEKKIRCVIQERYGKLGTITFHEVAVLFLFLILVFLWIFREPKFMPGWAEAVSTEVRIGNAVPVIGILMLMFLIPAEPWRWNNSPPLLNWTAVQLKLPWGLVLLLGGGFALAHGTQKSGLSNWIGGQMAHLSSLPPIAVLVILCVMTAGLTEVISNSTVATILLPVVSRMALVSGVHPLYWMIPVTIASSYAFMLPVATGPAAIVFDTGFVKTIDMVKPGIIMNVIACAIQVFMINTLGVVVFGLHGFPPWAADNSTTTTVT